MQLSPAQVAHYVDQGYLILPGLIGLDEVQALEEDLLALARGAYPCEQLSPLPAGLSDAEALERILCIHQPHSVSPMIRRFLAHPTLAGILGQIVGAHLAAGHWDGSVKCMQSMFFAKGPGKPGQAWHQDESYIATRDRSLCGAWLAVDDADEENGCLWVLPGSHRRGILYPQRPHGCSEFDSAEECYGFEDTGEVPVCLPRGGVVLFHGYLLHRSKANHSTHRHRRALVCHYMSGQSLLPWCMEGAIASGSKRVAMADYRCVVPVCGADDQSWRSYQPIAPMVHLRAARPRHGASSPAPTEMQTKPTDTLKA